MCSSSFAPGDYNLPTSSMEFDARDAYINRLDDRINQLKNQRDHYMVAPGTPEAAEQARIWEAKNRNRLNEIDRLEREKESIQDMDDVGRASLFGPRLFGARDLTTGERDALKRELKGK